MRRLMARSKVLFPDPDGPTTAVILPSRITISTSCNISVPPTTYPRPQISTPVGAKLGRLPLQVRVQAVEDSVRVEREGLVVGEGELHTPDHGVQPFGLGAPVLLVHEVGIMDYLGDLMEYPVLQLVVLQECLEGTGVPAVREPGPDHVEELCPLRGLRGIAEEGEGGLGIQESPYQPDACRPVHVAAPARGPQHQGLSSVPKTPDGPSLALAASRAALSASAAPRRRGERK